MYYIIIVDPAMLIALGTLASVQTSESHLASIAQVVIQLLNYAATHPNATICYHVSDMGLCTHRDTSYLSKPQACSHTGDPFFLSDKTANPTQAPMGQPELNVPVHTACHILCNDI
jgi:hypothetical protein